VCDDTLESVVAGFGLLDDDTGRATMIWVMAIGKFDLSAWRFAWTVWYFFVNRHMGQRLGSSALGLSDIALSAVGLSAVGLSTIVLSAVGLSTVGLSAVGLSAVGISAVGLSDIGLAIAIRKVFEALVRCVGTSFKF
jgi:hypothetical protein